MDNFIFLPDRSKVSAGNSATGELSVALGKNCTASGNYSLADGSGSIASGVCSVAMGNICDASGDQSIAMGANAITMYKQTVALGSTPLATGPYVGSIAGVSGGTDYAVDISKVYFVYRSPLGNSIEFVDATDYDGTSADFGSKIGLRYRSYDGSASELIFPHFRVAYSDEVSTAQILTPITTTFPALPNDTRLVSVTAWTMGSGSQCGGGVTFNIPSSELQTWYWGIWEGGPHIGQVFRLWNSSDADFGSGGQEGFTGETPGGVVTGFLGGEVGGATQVREWNIPGGAAGSPMPIAGAFHGGKVPGAACSLAELNANSTATAGIKVQWIG